MIKPLQFWQTASKVRWVTILFCLLGMMGMNLAATSEVSIRSIHEEPTGNSWDDPQDYFQIVINGKIYSSATFEGWRPIANFAGMDFAAIPSNGASGMIGVRIESSLDPNGNAYPIFTQELIESQIKRLKIDGLSYEREQIVLSEDKTVLEWSHRVIDKSGYVYFYYQLRLVGKHLWIFACQADSSVYDETYEMFRVLTGTFVRKK